MIELKKYNEKIWRSESVGRHYTDIPQGKIIGLVGENGSGKTTLLEADGWIVDAEFGKRSVWREADNA